MIKRFLLTLALLLFATPAWAAWTVTTATSTTTPASTDHVISLPASIVSGNMLIAVWAPNATIAGTWPSGWTELWAVNLPASTGRVEVRYRIADGTEGATITVTGSSSTSSHLSYKINGHSGAAPAVGTASSGTSANADPPSLTPAWGAKLNLWIAIAAVDNTTVTGAPTNYTNLLAPTVATQLGSAQRELNAATEDPGVFTNASDQWAANTLAVEPAAAGGAVPPRRAPVITQRNHWPKETREGK